MKEIINWEKLNEMINRAVRLRKPEKKDLANISAAIQAFWTEPQIIAGKVQAFTFSPSIPTNALPNWNTFLREINYDEFWKLAFEQVPLADGRDSWEIVDLYDAFSFKKMAEGERLAVYGMSGTKSTIYTAKYGGAIGWNDEVFRFRKLAEMSSMAKLFRARHYRQKADTYYNLIYQGAVAGGTTTYQGAATDTQLNRDLETVNAAAYTIGNRIKELGYTMGRYVLYLPENMRTRGQRMRRATDAIIPSGSSNGALVQDLAYNVDIAFTWSTYIPNSKGVLCIPGNKAQWAQIDSPFVLSDSDILNLTYVQALWDYHGGAIGDSRQFQLVNFS